MSIQLLFMLAIIVTGADRYDIYRKDGTINYAFYFSAYDTAIKPSVTVEKIVLDPIHVIYVNDTADKIDLPKVFGKAYSELFAFAFNNQLKPLKPMAFYYSHVDPLFLEIAVEVDKIPEQLNGRIKSKTIAGGEAVVAHYKGPYEQLKIPYNAISAWLKENKREGNGLPFESYPINPGVVTDNNELKTDVYQLLR